MVETRPLLTSLGLSDTKVLKVTLTSLNVREFDVTSYYYCYATADLVWFQPPRLHAHGSFLFSSLGAKPSPFISIQLTPPCRVREGRAERAMKTVVAKTHQDDFSHHNVFGVFFCIAQETAGLGKKKNVRKAIVSHPTTRFWRWREKNTNRQSFKRWNETTHSVQNLVARANGKIDGWISKQSVQFCICKKKMQVWKHPYGSKHDLIISDGWVVFQPSSLEMSDLWCCGAFLSWVEQVGTDSACRVPLY